MFEQDVLKKRNPHPYLNSPSKKIKNLVDLDKSR